MDIDLTTLDSPIDENGNYYLDVDPGDEVVFEVDGTFGGRTVTLCWVSAAGNWNAVKDSLDEDIAKTAAFIARATVGRTGRLGIQVSGAGDAPSLRPAWVNVSRLPGRGFSGGVPAA